MRTITADITDLLEQYQEQINARLAWFFDAKIEEASGISEHTRDVVAGAKEYTLRGGKRLRPIFCIYGYKCLCAENDGAIFDAAISLELMQSYLLIHDDIMDEDELRRGRRTFHILCKELCERQFGRNKAQKFGENVAIVGGDLLESYGAEVLATSAFKSEYVQRALVAYAKIVKNVGYGQILDLTAERKGSFSEDEILTIHHLKTASYTIEGPLHIGALLAGATEADLTVLSNYGIPLGLAFQIQDDILGLFGSEMKTGKPVGSDIREGKKTLLILHALEWCTDADKAVIFNALGNEVVTDEELEAVRAIVKETGSLEYSKERVRELTEKAVATISGSRFRDEAKEFLVKIADFIGRREY
ncbi:MAG: polyprenyl synthetase family protein [Candidatus Methanospirareceae archaeon]